MNVTGQNGKIPTQCLDIQVWSDLCRRRQIGHVDPPSMWSGREYAVLLVPAYANTAEPTTGKAPVCSLNSTRLSGTFVNLETHQAPRRAHF